MQIILDKGQCLESVWSYNPNMPCFHVGGKPTIADTDASDYKNSFFIINHNNVTALKQALSFNKIIPFSIPVYDSWYKSAETKRTGRITLPLPKENKVGGHSMVLVGYEDDNDSIGGGYFIVRNSWGLGWGAENFYGAGYGVIPYSYIENHCWESFSF